MTAERRKSHKKRRKRNGKKINRTISGGAAQGQRDDAKAAGGSALRSWVVWGAFLGTAGFLLSGFCLHFVHKALRERGVYTLTEAQEKQRLSLYNRRKRYLIALTVMLFVTRLGHFLVEEMPAEKLARGIRFQNLEDFIAYMETEPPVRDVDNLWGEAEAGAAGGEAHYYDKEGNEISEEEYRTESLYYDDGSLAAKFIKRNDAVYSFSYRLPRQGAPSFKVITHEEVQAVDRIRDALSGGFVLAYGLELLIAAGAYLIRKH